MATTPNYSFSVYSSTDTDVRFLDFRVATAGSQSTSNFYVIDTVLKQHSDAIDSINATPSAFVVKGTYSSGSLYTASVANYPGYKNEQLIVLSLNQKNTGAVQININGTTNKDVMKYGSDGVLKAVEAGDFVANSPVLCLYDGTRFVVIGITSASSITVTGEAGDILQIADDGTIESSGKKAAQPNGIATLDADGKLVQTAKLSDNATTADTADAVVDGSIVTASFSADAVCPTAAKTSQALTIQLNGTAQPTFNGSTARTINVTPASIGAATTGALDGVVSDLTDGTTVVAQADKVTNALVIMSNSGTALVNYDGSATANMTLSPSNVGAEPAFTKNTAFNKNFGSSAGTVCQGNDGRLSDARRSSNITMSLSGTNLSISYS